MKRRHKVDFSLNEFHKKFLNDKKFLRLYREWIKSGKDKWKKPSIDRINNKKHYSFNNIQIITWGENRYKQKMERRSRKGKVVQFFNGKPIAIFKSQKEVSKKLNISQGNLSEHMNGKRKHCNGYVFKWLNDIKEVEVIGNIFENPELLERK